MPASTQPRAQQPPGRVARAKPCRVRQVSATQRAGWPRGLRTHRKQPACTTPHSPACPSGVLRPSRAHGRMPTHQRKEGPSYAPCHQRRSCHCRWCDCPSWCCCPQCRAEEIALCTTNKHRHQQSDSSGVRRARWLPWESLWRCLSPTALVHLLACMPCLGCASRTAPLASPVGARPRNDLYVGGGLVGAADAGLFPLDPCRRSSTGAARTAPVGHPPLWQVRTALQLQLQGSCRPVHQLVAPPGRLRLLAWLGPETARCMLRTLTDCFCVFKVCHTESELATQTCMLDSHKVSVSDSTDLQCSTSLAAAEFKAMSRN